MDKKSRVGKEIAGRVTAGQVIGIGTGSTVDAALVEIGRRVRDEKLDITVVPTSFETAWRCEELGIVVRDAGYRGELAWGFDGADAVDKRLRAIKGRGGAMLREKILAARCKSYTLIVDDSKWCDNIAQCPVPVEVRPEAAGVAECRLAALGARSIALRMGTKKHGPVITEGGNIILDVEFGEIDDGLEQRVKAIVGVVESGLFLRYATEVLVATDTEVLRYAAM